MIEQQFGIEILPLWHDEERSGNAEAYARDVRAELARILLSRTGRGLAAALRFHTTRAAKPPVQVMPYEGGGANAQEDGVTRGSSRSVVLFTAATLGSCCSDGKSAALPHEILFHELVHSLRRVSGQLRTHPLGDPLKTYASNEEFLAVLVTNIFISDATNPHKTSLRANHMTHASLAPQLATSLRFFSLGTQAFNIVANFCKENRGFTLMLATVPARFNPIAAYYKNQHKAFERAADADSEYVFEGMAPQHGYTREGDAWERLFYSWPGPKPGDR